LAVKAETRYSSPNTPVVEKLAGEEHLILCEDEAQYSEWSNKDGGWEVSQLSEEAVGRISREL
jgi:hypothetical protein